MSDQGKVTIIAEAGVNHNKDIGIALKLVDVAKQCGADWVKFQTFISELEIDESAVRADYQVANMGEKAAGMTQLEMSKSIELPQSAFAEIKAHADKIGIKFMSTPFDPIAVETLAKLNVEKYKLSSCCLTNYPLLVEVAKQGKPVILSCGMSEPYEIEFGIQSLRDLGVKDISLLHCVSNYPATEVADYNLLVISELIKKYPDVTIGWSDHTPDSFSAVMAIALGAKIVEKHFTLDKNMDGPDHLASSSPEEFKTYIDDVRWAESEVAKTKPSKELALKLGAEILQKRYGKTDEEAQKLAITALGNGQKCIMPSEKNAWDAAKRSIYSYGAIPKGKLIRAEDLLCKRPPGGIHPTHVHEIIGKRAAVNIGPEQRLDRNMIEREKQRA